MEQYNVGGMTCAACQARVEKAVSKVDGVKSVSVSLLTNSMGVEGDCDPKDIVKAVEEAGYSASPKNKSVEVSNDVDSLKDTETPKLIKRLIKSVVFLLMLMYVSMGHNMLGWPLPSFLHENYMGLALVQLILSTIVLIVNSKFFVSGWNSVKHGTPNMDTLVALGSGVAYVWSIWVMFVMTGTSDHMLLMEHYHNELYFEAAATIPALITVGKMLEALSKGRTTDALKSLMKLAPQKATILVNDELKEVNIQEVKVGDTFVVKPGETVPVDGVITKGSTSINESALTGESVPVDKNVDDTVSAATMNTTGYFEARATRVGEDTTLSKIIAMVSDAAATKAPIARIADKVSGVFVPVVIGISLVVTIGWLIVGSSFADALARGIAVLVISCPCALGLATPVAIMVGNGMGAKHGILFKTSEALEIAGKMDIVALDKTGTITKGEPEVTDIFTYDVSEEELLKIAYTLESKSEHPLAYAIVNKAKENNISLGNLENFKSLSGSGIEGMIDGITYHAGNERFIQIFATISTTQKNLTNTLANTGKTPLFFERQGKVIGIIAEADQIKEDSKSAIQDLKKMGLEVVMLTGDNEATAKAIAQQAGVSRVVAGVLPDGKESVINELQKYGKVAMVGDGINDAPALTRADLGIAIGAGTDVAIDSADVVLMNSKLSDVASGIRLSRATLQNIYENLFWAFIYNIVCIPLAAGLFGWKMNPMWGAAAMSLSSFSVCMNALRLNMYKLHSNAHDKAKKNKVHLPENIFGIKEDTKELTVHIEGMTCEHCERRVEKAIGSIDGVVSVKADHTTNSATIHTNKEIDSTLIKQAVENEDYIYVDENKEENNMEKTLQIEGMSCHHCEMRVQKALESLEGVESAVASAADKKAVVTLSKDVDDAALKKAVEDQDYTVLSVTK